MKKKLLLALLFTITLVGANVTIQSTANLDECIMCNTRHCSDDKPAFPSINSMSPSPDRC